MEAKINEIFSSIQGEGPVVGYKQLFIRFCGCNLNCEYCDTDFRDGIIYTPQSLYEKILKEYDLKTFHSISLTGGEPLLSWRFLKEFLPMINGKVKIYLETNSTLVEELEEIINYIDIIAGDIKLKTASGMDIFENNRKFFIQCKGKDTFGKIVFDKNISESEINEICELALQSGISLILQPMMKGSKMSVDTEFCIKLLDKFTKIYPDTRLIPQVHKFLNVR